MENQINFKQLENNWYQGELTIGNQRTLINGRCEKNPTAHLQAAYRFFVQGGYRAQCAFNQDSGSHLLVLRRDSNVINLEVIHLDEQFESNAKLKSMKVLNDHVAFSAQMPLENLPDALFAQKH